jgi:hypothetical protein
MELTTRQSGLTTSLLGLAAVSGGQAFIDQSLTTMTALIMHGIAQSISFGIIVLGVSVFCWILQIIFMGISKLPVIGTINRLAGILIGMILGGAIIAVMLWVFSIINLSTGGVSNLPTAENSNLLQLAIPMVINYMGIQ